MTTAISLKCQCGAMRGELLDVSPTRSTRLVCHCDDCQAFTTFLGREDVMDDHGGTELLHVTPAQVRITHGAEQLRCMRLSDKGMLRWYAACCRTPIANSLTPARLPFVSLTHAFVDPSTAPRTLDAAFGPIRYRIMARFARNGVPPNAHDRAPIGLILGSIRMLAIGFVKGKYAPSAFLDNATGQPRVAVQVLTKEERDALRPADGAHAKA
jgi:hypothetical protein